MSSPSAKAKACSDMEWKPEVDAEERPKRKDAARPDSRAARRSPAAARARGGKKRGRPSKAAGDASPAGEGKKKRGRSKSGPAKRSIKSVRKQRRIQQSQVAERAAREEAKKTAQKGDLGLDDHEGNIIAPAQEKVNDAAAPEDFFWEVNAVVGRRIKRGRVEYLIRWKGCSEDDNTWEPTANLCDTAMEEAMKYTQELKRKEKQREEDERKLFGPPEGAADGAADEAAEGGSDGVEAGDASMEVSDIVDISEPNDDNGAGKADGNADNGDGKAGDNADNVAGKAGDNADDGAGKADDPISADPGDATLVVDDHLWKWGDADQVVFRDVERIDVNDPNAGRIVTDARVNGTPLVLVGHVGWADFARRWLTKKKAPRRRKANRASGGGSEGKGDGGEAMRTSAEVSAEKESNVGKASVAEQGGSEGESKGKGDGGEAVPASVGVSADKATDVGKANRESEGESKGNSDGREAIHTPVDVSAKEATDADKAAAIEQGGQKEDGVSSTEEDSGTEKADRPDGTVAKEDSMAVDTSATSANAAADEKASVLISTEEDKRNLMAIDARATSTASATLDKAAAYEKAPVWEPTQDDLQKESSVSSKKEETKAPSNKSTSGDLLDLSQQNYELNIKKMIKDIGEEDVPVIRKHYNEVKPIHGRIAAEKFLTNCWPTPESETDPTQQERPAKNHKNASNLYLHQWQFPLSDTAGRKLCHQNNPLPKGIMGEDLLRYWLDLPQCKLDSPLQYIFMGRQDTLSKLHRDPGGLEISIAPIVGEKECVLVHRSDGSNCLYHLTASLEDINLQRHPLLTQARAWRTVVRPGEILLMPYGTYHQCRNLTPCLSYSRFHLDTVNLLPFVQSLFNGDAPEIDQEEVLWNLTSEFIRRVDEVFDEVQLRVKAGRDERDLITGDVVETVNTLRTLRHFVREVARRDEIKHVVKGSGRDSDGSKNEEHNFDLLVDDVDMCLHEFRYRQSKTIPPFKARRGKTLKNTLSKSSGRSNMIKRDMSKFGVGVVAFNTSLENNYMSLVKNDLEKHFPNASKDKVGESLIGELKAGDKISVKLEQKFVKAEVVEIVPQMKSAYLSFEDYPSLYDEYQPYELIRLPTGAEIPPEDVKPGLVVIDLSNSNEYRAKIQSIESGPMARVKLIVSQHEMTRLVSPSMILGRYVPPKRKAKKASVKNYTETATIEKREVAPPIMRPTKAGQIVEVGRRGAARVTKVHGEPAAHVDVAFILGNAHSESMIPIDQVQLAPELDPESGRGRRQVANKENEAKTDGSNASKKLADGLVSPSSAGSSD